MNLLTGATGFVGGHVVEYLFQQNEISKAVFRMGSHLKILDLNGVQGIEASLLDHHSLHEAVEGVDTIYSMASPMPGFDSDFRKVNVEGVKNLIDVATESGVKTIVHLSTIDVYGFRSSRVNQGTTPAPEGEYQTSKSEADSILLGLLAKAGSPRVVVVRAARAIGSRDEALAVPILKAIAGGKVVVPGGSVMSFTHPRDIAQAMYKAATGPTASGTFLVKSFDASPEDLVRQLIKSVGRSAEVQRAGLFAKPALPEYSARQLRASLRIDSQPSWKELGYSPDYDLEKTAGEIAGWCKREPWVTGPL